MKTTIILLVVLVVATLSPLGIDYLYRPAQAQAITNIWLDASQPDGVVLRPYDFVSCRVAAVNGDAVRLACQYKAAPNTATPKPTWTRAATATKLATATRQPQLTAQPWPWVTYAKPTNTQVVQPTLTPRAPTATSTYTPTSLPPTATDVPPTATPTQEWGTNTPEPTEEPNPYPMPTDGPWPTSPYPYPYP